MRQLRPARTRDAYTGSESGRSALVSQSLDRLSDPTPPCVRPCRTQDLWDAQQLYSKAVADREGFDFRAAAAEAVRASMAVQLGRAQQQVGTSAPSSRRGFECRAVDHRHVRRFADMGAPAPDLGRPPRTRRGWASCRRACWTFAARSARCSLWSHKSRCLRQSRPRWRRGWSGRRRLWRCGPRACEGCCGWGVGRRTVFRGRRTRHRHSVEVRRPCPERPGSHAKRRSPFPPLQATKRQLELFTMREANARSEVSAAPLHAPQAVRGVGAV